MIGSGELLVVAIVTLLVIKPKQFPEVIRFFLRLKKIAFRVKDLLMDELEGSKGLK